MIVGVILTSKDAAKFRLFKKRILCGRSLENENNL